MKTCGYLEYSEFHYNNFQTEPHFAFAPEVLKTDHLFLMEKEGNELETYTVCLPFCQVFSHM